MKAQRLLGALGLKHPKYLDVITLRDRLQANIDSARIYGDPETRKTERSEIWHELMRISLDVFEVPIDEVNVGPRQQPVSLDLASPEIPKPGISQPNNHNGPLVFISHSSKDKPFVNRLEKDLTQADLQIWYDKKNIKVAQSIPGEINAALSDCQYFLVVLSPNALAAPWVTKEIDAALMQTKTIVPVLLKECPIPALLRAYKYADFRADYQSGLEELLDGIKEPSPIKINLVANAVLNNPSPGFSAILEKTERMVYNGDISLEQGQTLEEFYKGVEVKKQKGEKPMSPATSNPDEIFSYSMQVLAYDLVSLSEYHAEWSNLIASDRFKRESIKLLNRMQSQILVSSALIQQARKLDCSFEVQHILTPLESLQTLLKTIDNHLLSGKVPFQIRNDIENGYNDLTYHLNKYLLLLDDLAKSSDGRRFVQ